MKEYKFKDLLDLMKKDSISWKWDKDIYKPIKNSIYCLIKKVPFMDINIYGKLYIVTYVNRTHTIAYKACVTFQKLNSLVFIDEVLDDGTRVIDESKHSIVNINDTILDGDNTRNGLTTDQSSFLLKVISKSLK